MKKTMLRYGLIVGSALIVLTAIFLIVFFNRKVEVPDVTGKSIVEATKLMDHAGLKVKTDLQWNDKVLKDYVVSQNEASGVKIKYGTKITLVVSKGVEQITLPDLKNLSAEEAESALKKLGFNVITSEGFSSSIGKGNVMRQSVPDGATADKGSTISITISKGPDLVTVPNVKGMVLENVKQTIKDSGLNLEIETEFSNNVKEGNIISQSIAGGKQVERHTTVNIKVSAGVANTKGTTSANANSFGMVTSQGNWIYFAGGSTDGIYRMHKVSGEKQLISGTNALGINVIGEWIYYVNDGIYKVKLDGTGTTKLNNTVSYKLYVEGEWIYYTSEYWGGKLYKMKTDGTSKTKITNKDCTSYIINGEDVYYACSSNNLVYKCRTDGTGETVLCAGFGGIDLTLSGDRLMVVSNSGDVQSVNLDGSGFKSFTSNNSQYSFLNGYDGWVYYLKHEFNKDNVESSFCKMKPDGSQKTKIYDYDFLNHANSYLNVVDDWIYFQNEHDGDSLYRVKIDGTKEERMG